MTTWTKNQSFINQTDVSYGGEGVLVMKAIIYEKERKMYDKGGYHKSKT